MVMIGQRREFSVTSLKTTITEPKYTKKLLYKCGKYFSCLDCSYQSSRFQENLILDIGYNIIVKYSY